MANSKYSYDECDSFIRESSLLRPCKLKYENKKFIINESCCWGLKRRERERERERTRPIQKKKNSNTLTPTTNAPAMAEKLNATLLELVSVVSGNGSEHRSTINGLRWAQRLIAKRHYSAVHAKSVHQVYEEGLLERLSVLGRPDLADMLRDKLSFLDKQDYVTAQILLMLKQLSMNPETSVSRPRALEICGRDQNSENDIDRLKNSLIIDEIMDGLADDVENWNIDWAFTDEANAMYMEEDEDFTEESRSASPVSEIDGYLTRGGSVPGREEFVLLLQALQDSSRLPPMPDLSGGAVDTELQQFREQSYWNLKVTDYERPIIISEATAVREVILALCGLPSILIIETDDDYIFSVADEFRILHFSRPMLVTLLMVAREQVLSSWRVREYLRIDKPSLLQVFDSALEEIVLKPFYAKLYEIESSVLSSDTAVITSLSNLSRDVKAIVKTWEPILQILDVVTEQLESRCDPRLCFATILSQLYTATKASHYGVLASPNLSTSAFNTTVQIFSWCLDHYCGKQLDSWMRTTDKQVHEQPRTFIEENQSHNQSSYWASRYRINSSLVPHFLKPLARYIYEAGLSLRFLDETCRQANMPEYRERPTGLSYDSVVGGTPAGDQQKQHELWWLKLHSRLEKWVLGNHMGNAQTLLDTVYRSGMIQELNSYTQMYMMLNENPPVMANFLEKTFDRLLVQKKKGQLKIDKFLVQEDFAEVWMATRTQRKRLKMSLEAGRQDQEENGEPVVLIDTTTTTTTTTGALDKSTTTNSLELLSQFRLKIPCSWIAQEVLGESSQVYQDIWIMLVRWSYAHIAVRTKHMELLRNQSSHSSQSQLTHAVLVFLNKMMEYFHISVLFPSYQKAKHLVQPPSSSSYEGSTNFFFTTTAGFNDITDPGSREGLLLSFQGLIDAQEDFIYTAETLCFLTRDDPFLANVKTILDNLLVYCVTDLTDIKKTTSSSSRGRRRKNTSTAANQTDDGYNKADDTDYYETVEYFTTSKLAPLQKALKLALANNSFADVEHKLLVQGLIDRLE